MIDMRMQTCAGASPMTVRDGMPPEVKSGRTTAILADDHDLVRAGLRLVLEDTVDIQVVGEADTGEMALELVRRLAPHVVVMDLNMPGMGGLEASRRILSSGTGTRVVGVSVYVDGTLPRRFLEAGAHGYLTKGSSAEELLRAIRAVRAGRRYISQEVAQRLALRSLGPVRDPLDELSERELQIMRMVAQGQNIHDIAERLHLSVKTVCTYRSRVQRKLGVDSDVALTHAALRFGLVQGSEV